MKTNLPPPPRSYRLSHKLLAPGLHMLNMSCSHFSDLTIQSMDRPLTSGEKVRYRFHFIACSVCRKFEKQIRSLSALVRTSFAEQPTRQPDPQFLAAVREKLDRIAAEPDDSNR